MRVEAYKITLTGVALCALAACVAPQHVQDEASMYLRGECLEMFLGFRYQHQAHLSFSHTVAFALGEGEMGNQSCAGVSASIVGVSDRDQLAAIAIARCNEFGARWGINCKLFAVENEIVWGKAEDVEFK